MRRRYAERMIDELRPRPDEPRRRGRQQRRLPAPALPRRGRSRSSGSSPPQTSRRWPNAEGIPTLVALLRRGARRRARRDGPPGRPDRRQQRPRPGARPQRLRRRPCPAAGAGRRCSRSSSRTCCGCSSGTSSTRSTTSTSRTSRSGRRPHLIGRHGLRSSTSRSCRRTADRCASTSVIAGRRRRRRRERVDAVLAARTSARRLRRGETYAVVRRAGRGDQAGLLEFLHRRARREGKSVAGYGAPGQGQHVPQLLRDRPRPARLHGRSQPATSTGMFMPGTRIPIAPGRTARRDASRLHPGSCRGTSATRSSRSSADARDWGAQFVVAIPRLEVV